MGKGGRESAAEGAKQTVAELLVAVRYTLKLRHDETVKLVDIGFYSDVGVTGGWPDARACANAKLRGSRSSGTSFCSLKLHHSFSESSLPPSPPPRITVETLS